MTKEQRLLFQKSGMEDGRAQEALQVFQGDGLWPGLTGLYLERIHWYAIGASDVAQEVNMDRVLDMSDEVSLGQVQWTPVNLVELAVWTKETF